MMLLNPTLIAIFGATGTGKTTFVNDASGGDLLVGNELHACTADVATSPVFEVDSRQVLLIDTPGFDDTSLSDTEVLKRISGFLASSYEKGHKLTGIIYLQRISDIRMGGASRRTFSMFRELCGKDSLTNVLIVTNMWSDPPTDVELSRESQLREDAKFFKPALDSGAQLVRRPHKDIASAHSIVRLLLNKNPIVMKLQQELVDGGQALSETGAGRLLNADLRDAHKRHQTELAEVQESMVAAIRENDLQTQLELKESLEEEKLESQRLAQQIESLRQGFREERVFWEQRIDEATYQRREAEERQRSLHTQMMSFKESLQR